MSLEAWAAHVDSVGANRILGEVLDYVVSNKATAPCDDAPLSVPRLHGWYNCGRCQLGRELSDSRHDALPVVFSEPPSNRQAHNLIRHYVEPRKKCREALHTRVHIVALVHCRHSDALLLHKPNELITCGCWHANCEEPPVQLFLVSGMLRLRTPRQ